MSLSKEQFEQSFKNKSYVDLNDLVQLIEDNFGYSVTLTKKISLSAEQKKQMTSAIFKDEGVLSQQRQVKKDREAGISTYCDSEEEFEKLLNEINDGK